MYRKFMTAKEKTRRSRVQHVVEARKRKEKDFFDLAKRFRDSNDPAKMKQLGDELGRYVFGQVPSGSKL